MSFYSATYLYLILLVPVLFYAAWSYQRGLEKSRSKFAQPDLFKKIANSEPPGRSGVRTTLTAVALILILVALARPQGGERVVEEEVEGIDIFLAIDVSRSMNARDLYPDRLTAIKNVVNDFVDASYGDRIGVVAFAGDASVICPLTTDHGSVLSFVDRLTTSEPLRPGTGIGNAIHIAVGRFRDTDAGKVLILLTDGENNKGIEPLDALQEAKNAGVRIYTVGIGTTQGAPLPEPDQPLVGRTRYRTDESGDPIMVGLDVETLQTLANETGGQYFQVSNEGELSTLYSRITREGETEFLSRRIVRRDELAPYFLLFAGLFLIMEAFYAYITPSEARRHAKARY